MGLFAVGEISFVSHSLALVNTPHTISIALGAALIGVFDYCLLVVLMAVVVAGCGIYLLTRVPEPLAAEENPVFA